MIGFYTNLPEYAAELCDVVKLFFDDSLALAEKDQADIIHECICTGENIANICSYGSFSGQNEHKAEYKSPLEEKKLKKRYAKLAVYQCLKQKFGSRPWGALTGIRPTRLAYDLFEKEGLDYKTAFSDIFDVSDKKIRLVGEILDMQQGYIESDDNQVDIYVNIPFCVSKCIYCSFPSGLIDKLAKYVQPYTECLKQEIYNALDIVEENGLKLKNVYFGGGTPTSLDAQALYDLTSIFKAYDLDEFTVEGGRPDTLTAKKLELLKECGVSRVSVNPQTFNEKTLERINRKHSNEDTLKAFAQAKAFGFIINMDLIAGLPEELEQDFFMSVDKCIQLGAENITVHTLALKRGSLLWENASKSDNESRVERMVDYAAKMLHEAHYNAYYMYRQKYVKGNLENVGYCLSGKQCRYNIDMMEERRSVIACGANSISKRIWKDRSRIERYAVTKDVGLYIERIKEVLKDKKSFFKA